MKDTNKGKGAVAPCLCLVLTLGISAVFSHTMAFAASASNPVQQIRQSQSADGIQNGLLIFYPTLMLEQVYDDNIFRAAQGERADWVTVLRPSFAIESDFDLHAINLRAGLTDTTYRRSGSEDTTAHTLSAGGRLDLAPATSLSAQANHRRAFEDRGGDEDRGADRPTEFRYGSQQLRFVRALSLIRLYVDVLHEQFRFEDNREGSVVVDNSGRDRDLYALKTRLSYAYRPGYELFVEGKTDWRRYDQAAAKIRDSEGRDLRIGMDIALSNLLKAEIYAGWLSRRYDSNFSDISIFNYGGSVDYALSALTAMTLSVTRDVEETSFADTSGNLKTRVGLSVDHALRPNILLRLDGGYALSDFKAQGAADRQDKTYDAGGGFEYFLPYDGLSFKARYDFRMRESDASDKEYKNNRILFSITQSF